METSDIEVYCVPSCIATESVLELQMHERFPGKRFRRIVASNNVSTLQTISIPRNHDIKMYHIVNLKLHFVSH